ncbi:hypothetical protein N2605_25965 [Bradyrhizobium yuanmingense]|uniref:hypothetical protein n=1 Tax=Bradyrhizobium yuanmingense TaxID=108015 RepID=UPI0021A2A933|nr:hypothetical protein [Bradyrhizobium sp. CB1024]UWU83003.1 hypothetical protein N2605_25965 [Bradyrhizobium sp. CB1024]
MVPNWAHDLIRRRPRLFETAHGEPSSGIPDIPEGWRDVVERLCVRIENALQAGETFRFIRTLKFGILRFDWAGEVSGSGQGEDR